MQCFAKFKRSYIYVLSPIRTSGLWLYGRSRPATMADRIYLCWLWRYSVLTLAKHWSARNIRGNWASYLQPKVVAILTVSIASQGCVIVILATLFYTLIHCNSNFRRCRTFGCSFDGVCCMQIRKRKKEMSKLQRTTRAKIRTPILTK